MDAGVADFAAIPVREGWSESLIRRMDMAWIKVEQSLTNNHRKVIKTAAAHYGSVGPDIVSRLTAGRVVGIGGKDRRGGR